ncbi:MAG: Holliday junction branch migration protein RuvA [Kiritimatiellia bacterium]
MIAYLKGILAEKTPSRVILDTGGVGYEVFVSLSTFDRLPATGAECFLLTYHHIREDTQILFGFIDEKEKSMFEMLLNVNGVGAKTALSILSGLNANELRVCISENNVKRISSVHGIGKKTAERIAMELRDKINPFEALAGSSGAETRAENTMMRDAVMALTSLGFAQDKAAKMIQSALSGNDTITDTEELLRKALSSSR